MSDIQFIKRNKTKIITGELILSVISCAIVYLEISIFEKHIHILIYIYPPHFIKVISDYMFDNVIYKEHLLKWTVLIKSLIAIGNTEYTIEKHNIDLQFIHLQFKAASHKANQFIIQKNH